MAYLLMAAATDSKTANAVLLDTVKLISGDGFEYIIDRKCAMASGTIKNMLSSPGQFTESLQNEIHFRDIKYLLVT